MTIGIEQDPVEDLEREIQRAVAAAARARFSQAGDPDAALALVHELTKRRLDLTPLLIPQAA